MSSSPELSEMAEVSVSPGPGSAAPEVFPDYYEEGAVASDKKVKPHAQAHLLSATEHCKICGERAARHVHYGATTCFSCRAFFRRSLQNNTAAKYVCRRKNLCEINSKTRRNCQYCRYMKCLTIGMNPNYVLSEDEKKKRFRRKNNSGGGTDEENVKSPAVAVVTGGFNTGNSFPSLEPIPCENGEKYLPSSVHQNIFDPSEPRYSQAGGGGPSKQMPPLEYTKLPNQVPAPDSSPQNRGSIIVKNETTAASPSSKGFPPQHQHFKTESYGLKQSQGQGQVSPLENDNFSLFRNELSASLPQPSSWYSNTGGMMEGSIKTESLPHSAGGDVVVQPTVGEEKEDLFDQGMMMYSAFDDIETGDFEDSSADTELEEINRRLLHAPDTFKTQVAPQEDEIARIVRDHDVVYFSVNFGEVLIKEMLMCSMFGVQVSTSAALQGYKLQVERMTRIANALPAFTSLCKQDQVALLKENADLVVSLRGAIFFDKKKRGMDQIMSSMGHKDREMIKIVFSSMMESQEMNHIEYKIFNSIQDPANKQTEDHYTNLQAKVADAICDHVTSVLMTYIILFSSDFVELQDKRQVERVQHGYVKLLERHTYSQVPAGCGESSPGSRLAAVLDAVTSVREMADIKKSRAINTSSLSATTVPYDTEDTAPEAGDTLQL